MNYVLIGLLCINIALDIIYWINKRLMIRTVCKEIADALRKQARKE